MDYEAMVKEYSQIYAECNQSPEMLIKRWRNDLELQLVVNMIHDILHEPPASKIERDRIKKLVPDVSDDEIRFMTITAVILGYWRAEA